MPGKNPKPPQAPSPEPLSPRPETGGAPGEWRFRRVLLKISGEVLQGAAGFGLDAAQLQEVASQIAELSRLGIVLGVVVGGGNIFRGKLLIAKGLDRVTGDQMGMLATLINALAIQDALSRLGSESRVLCAFPAPPLCETHNRLAALRHLEKGRVIIFAGGTGSPFFTTDTAAALRAGEMRAEAILKATKVDGVYDRDPALDAGARLFPTISYAEAIARGLGVMDQAAMSLAQAHGIPTVVFNLKVYGNILKVVRGEALGTTVTPI